MGKAKRIVPRTIPRNTRQWQALIRRYPYCGSAYPDCPQLLADREHPTCKVCAIMQEIMTREKRMREGRMMVGIRKKKIKYAEIRQTVVATLGDGTLKTFSVKAWDKRTAIDKVREWLEAKQLVVTNLE